jgi:hypothetical protein
MMLSVSGFGKKEIVSRSAFRRVCSWSLEDLEFPKHPAGRFVLQGEIPRAKASGLGPWKSKVWLSGLHRGTDIPVWATSFVAGGQAFLPMLT